MSRQSRIRYYYAALWGLCGVGCRAWMYEKAVGIDSTRLLAP